MKYTRVIINRHGGLDVLNVIEEELGEAKNKNYTWPPTNQNQE
jgi:hypothetical protein